MDCAANKKNQLACHAESADPALQILFYLFYLFPNLFVWKTKQSSSTWLDRDLFPRRPLPTMAPELPYGQTIVVINLKGIYQWHHIFHVMDLNLPI